MITTLLLWGCGSEQQIIEPYRDCDSDVEVAPIVYELTCPEIPACPSVELSCPEVTVPECPDVNVVCPEPVVTVEAPTVINDSPDITVEPSQCNTTYNATCECPEIEIPECPSLDSVTVELDAELTIDGDDFLSDLANIINGPQEMFFLMETYSMQSLNGCTTQTTPCLDIGFENTTNDTFILTGLSRRRLGHDSSCSIRHVLINGDPALDLIDITGALNSNNTMSPSLLTYNEGAIPLEPGDFLEVSFGSSSCSTPSSSALLTLMGYYQ